MRIFGQLLLVDKQKVPYLYKTTFKEFEFLHNLSHLNLYVRTWSRLDDPISSLLTL
jgi:hypothetical protein